MNSKVSARLNAVVERVDAVDGGLVISGSVARFYFGPSFASSCFSVLLSLSLPLPSFPDNNSRLAFRTRGQLITALTLASSPSKRALSHHRQVSPIAILTP